MQAFLFFCSFDLKKNNTFLKLKPGIDARHLSFVLFISIGVLSADLDYIYRIRYKKSKE
jgi:hypothetical protein